MVVALVISVRPSPSPPRDKLCLSVSSEKCDDVYSVSILFDIALLSLFIYYIVR